MIPGIAGSVEESGAARARLRAGVRAAPLWGACLFALQACFLAGASDPFPVSGDEQRGSTFTLEVENQNFSDARIYLIVRGQRRRVALVTGKTTRFFELPAGGENEIRVEADFVGGGVRRSDAIFAWPGDTIYFQIPPS